MSENRQTANPTPWMIAALAASAWGLVAVAFALLAPPSLIPHIFYSYHVEHFAAFYVLAAVASAGLPRQTLTTLSLGLIAFAIVLEVIRMLTPTHRLTSAEDLVCDIAGVLAAYAPILIGRFRDSPTRTQS
jgi:Na+/H+-dicarboxylate symporter